MKSERVPKVLKRPPKEITKIEEFIPRVGILTSLEREVPVRPLDTKDILYVSMNPLMSRMLS